MTLDRFNFKDALAVLVGKKRAVSDSFRVHSDVEIAVYDKSGNLKSHSFQHNLRTNVGADFWFAQLFGTSGILGQARTASYMAITSDAAAASASDTTLASEETSNGLQRTAQLAATHSSGATSCTFANTFTYTGSSTKTMNKLGLFNNIAGGTLVLESLLNSPATVNASGDFIIINWTISF